MRLQAKILILLLLFGLSLMACDPAPAPEVSPSPSGTLQISATSSPLPDTAIPEATASPRPTQSGTLSPFQATEAAFNQERAEHTPGITPSLSPSPTPSLTPSLTPTASPSPTPFIDPVGNPPANHIIYVSDRLGSDDIWLMDIDGGNPHPLTLWLDSRESSPSCSLRGDGFVFVSDRGNSAAGNNEGNREIYLGAYDGSAPRPLTDTEGENYSPHWSPRNDLIAFVSTRDGQADIWIMDNGGGNVQRISQTDNAEEAAPMWTADGTQIVYTSGRDGQSEIYLYDLASETETRLSFTPDLNEFNPAPAYDGLRYAYITGLEGYLELLSGETRQHIASAVGRVDHPSWLTDDHLIFSANLGGVTHILLHDLRNNGQAILSNIGPRNTQPRPCYLSHDTSPPALPIGHPPTATPSQSLALSSAYIPVVNPGADWQTLTLQLTEEDLSGLLADDPRLAGAELLLIQDELFYTWRDAEENFYRLTLALERRDGALGVLALSYTRNAEAEALEGVSDIAFLLREAILTRGILSGAGFYHLAGLALLDDGFELRFSLPPQED